MSGSPGRPRYRVSALLDRVHREQSLAGAMWTWCVLAAGTVGLATGPLLWYGGRRLSSRRLRLWASGYLALSGAVLIAARAGLSAGGLAGAWAALWLVGSVHAASTGRRVWYACRGELAGAAAYPAAPALPAEPAIERVGLRAARRREARRIAGADPDRARELRIGRPDLAGHYDDGGLVDVNHVPAAVLRTELRLPAEVARRVVDERSLRSGFGSAEEMIVFCELPPDLVAMITDRLIFGPRS